VLLIGNTGSGKSTLISSIINGCENLENKKIEENLTITKTDGTVK